MMSSTQIVTEVITEPEQQGSLGSLVIKTQLCGKKNCCCVKQQLRHGPYAWLVEYVPKGKREEGKTQVSYKWKYLGKAREGKKDKLLQKLKEEAKSGAYETLERKLNNFIAKFEDDPAYRKKIMQKPKTDLT